MHSIADIIERDEHLVAAALSRSNLVRHVPSAQADAYELGHELFYASLEKQVNLAAWRDRVTRWVANYAERSWPEETPEFILSEYPERLNVERLADLVTIEFRARVSANLGTEHHLVIAIREAIARHLHQDGLDLEAVARLTLHRLDIVSRRSVFPVGLIQAHIADGRTDYAYQLAKTSKPGTTCASVDRHGGSDNRGFETGEPMARGGAGRPRCRTPNAVRYSRRSPKRNHRSLCWPGLRLQSRGSPQSIVGRSSSPLPMRIPHPRYSLDSRRPLRACPSLVVGRF